jgi:hypothetical protein
MPISAETRRRAKAVIVEIIRQHGGSMRSKTHLFKAFWKANVAAAQVSGKPLTSYPIVRMPRGPGIHNVSRLLGELMAEDAITVDPPSEDPYDPFEFALIDETAYEGFLSREDREAIAAGVAAVRGKSAAQISEESHRDSRSWNNSENGEELDIFLDAVPDLEFTNRDRGLRVLAGSLEALLHEQVQT